MSTACAIKSVDALQKLQIGLCNFAQTTSDFLREIALLAVSFARCLQKVNRVRMKRTILLTIFPIGGILEKHRMA